MSDIVDRWVEKLIDLPNIGEMTHTERMLKAFSLEEPDMVPIAPQLDQYQVIHAGYNFFEVWDDVEKATDAVIKTWADLRTDAIWSYYNPAINSDPYIAPAARAGMYDLRDGKSYVVFKEVAPNIDDCIKLFEKKVWREYGLGKLETFGVPHEMQVTEFCRKMGGKITALGGIPTPTCILDIVAGTQNFVRWTVTEKEKTHHLLGLVAERQLEVLDMLTWLVPDRPIFTIIEGGRTFGPRQWDEFGAYDRIVANKAAHMFKYVMLHFCGYNVPYVMDLKTTFPYAAIQYDEPLPQLDWSWAKWTEWVARLGHGKFSPMNAPTCQQVAYRSPEFIENSVKVFIEHTAPHTPPVIMPGCEITAMTPRENVEAMVNAGRKWGKYPECKTRAEQVWTEEEFQASLTKYGAKIPSWSRSWRPVNGKAPWLVPSEA
jgi:uroporphyrinogen-III decarboxylase